MDYCWIQKSIVSNVTSKNFEKARDQLNHINHSYTFLPTTCTTTKDIDLDWDDFVEIYKLLYCIIAILEHVIKKFLDLLHFLDFWVYKEEKDISFIVTLALGKARTCKGAGEKGSSGVTSHAPMSVGECEQMNPHTFKDPNQENLSWFAPWLEPKLSFLYIHDLLKILYIIWWKSSNGLFHSPIFSKWGIGGLALHYY
jgi:hypothetical protein